MTTLAEQLPTFGQYLLNRFGERVHKIALDTAFTCPNRDGTKGVGGCTFCNNVSFSPNGRHPKPISEQLQAGREVIRKRTGAKKYLAYFQAYTNTYDSLERLAERYEEALAEQDVIGLSIGTRPDCVPDGVLELLAGYQAQGYEIWLELGLQSAFDETLKQVNRGHGFAEYQDALLRARGRDIKVCTHLIAGLPGETAQHNRESLRRVTALGTDGLKLHPLHVVKGTQLANSWRSGQYTPLTMHDYIQIAADLVEQAPDNIVWHRLTGTASETILLTPAWCALKWQVLNGIARELQRRRQSCRNVA
ncbi:MAG: TIGR01212 family radical SAM protein [Candidatus Thiodiazotropha taylori]|nr:TIGR01212 family radical SAM protein [Candidatus Thiodiazotropha taylori]MCW4327324.1 TIGR01212 family radical SAM protein [Candidatus Thiodiazotropha taylori]